MGKFVVLTNGNIGTVYVGNSFEEAIRMYKSWCKFITEQKGFTDCTTVEMLENSVTTVVNYMATGDEHE